VKKRIVHTIEILLACLSAGVLCWLLCLSSQSQPQAPEATTHSTTQPTTQATTGPLTGWQLLDGQRYYFNGAGEPVSGWIQWLGHPYYLNADGTTASGWLQTAEGSFYLDRNGSPITGWLALEGDYFYFSPEGTLCTGWVTIADQRYYFDDSGRMQSGWLTLDEERYYLDPQGRALTGWHTLEDQRYYFEETGALHSGWLEIGEYRYYLREDGTPVTGKQEIDGQTCYFTPKGIWVLLTNKQHPLPKSYTPTLVEAEDDFQVDLTCQPALAAMFAAMRQEGLYPLISSAYRGHGEQIYLYERYVNQFKADGYSEERAKAKAEKYVAPPGTSEHHTGLAVDIVGWNYYYGTRPGSTQAVQAWLAEHCWEYGFILRYTEEKTAITGFAAENWHFRYVGVDVSMDMKDTGLCLEEYLGAV